MIESPPEFSRPIDRRQIMQKPVHLVATEAERAALARRFGVVSLSRLEATLDLYLNGETVTAKGRMSADLVQACAVSGNDLAQSIDETLALTFVPDKPIEVEELELEEHQLDEIAYTGTTFDLGEAVAQSVGLAIDPYAVGPDADRVRREKGLLDESAAGPFAALAALKKDG